MKQRSYELEIIDLGPDHYTRKEYYDTLEKLGRIGKYLGAEASTINAFKAYAPLEAIVDVGCGGGHFSAELAHQFPNAQVVGIDINPEAIHYAAKNPENNKYKNLSFEYREDSRLTLPDKSFDIVTATLVCHHLDNEQLIDFLRQAQRVARKAIIINDLVRSRVAWLGFLFISPFFLNRLIFSDGLLSIKRSFRWYEINEFLQAAGFVPSQYKITWCWPFRWVIEVKI